MLDNQRTESVGPQGLKTEGVAIWRALVAEAQDRPWMWRLLTTKGAELLERVIANYQSLLALSRQQRRALMRKAGMGLAGVALLVSLNAGAAWAGTITVTGPCTLTEAIDAANTDAPTANCPAGSGDDTIVLTADVTLTANYAGQPYYFNGLPRVTTTITIDGNNHTISRDGGASDKFRILEVYGGNLTLNDTTISGGDLLGTTSPYGGGIAVVNASTLTLNNSVVSMNSAYGSGGIHSNGYSTVTINNSQIITNTATYKGAGLQIESGALINSTVSGNTSTVSSPGSKGGGIIMPNVPGVVTIENSTISGNTAAGSPVA